MRGSKSSNSKKDDIYSHTINEKELLCVSPARKNSRESCFVRITHIVSRSFGKGFLSAIF